MEGATPVECPICGGNFAVAQIEAHADGCLEAQSRSLVAKQVADDERMAQELSGSSVVDRGLQSLDIPSHTSSPMPRPSEQQRPVLATSAPAEDREPEPFGRQMKALYEPSTICTEVMAAMLWSLLPERVRFRHPRQVYLSSRDGFSLTTLIRSCDQDLGVLLLIQTNKAAIMGAYLTHPLKYSAKYYGGRECMVFCLAPEPRAYTWQLGHTDYFVHVAEDVGIEIGGGGSGCSIWLEPALDKGATHRSSTFLNDPLTGTDETQFRCIHMEAYTLH